ncbi:MAG: hypothetical protein ACD_65C00237G0001 [uncultured bacterium]|nr:MAG: hypothetical protein ACD_65C00237G0001 [uncultured bacterium]KKT02062.1 MAG: hypothetical protein UV80_C0006G0052 [Candidatus Peregrinibacteria bacterium GW2011_GWF2_43_17]KKT19578.1 MAG: hypothetical protein UW03_C0016G0035 [Candidatus Peregrinibacteria bacterium GW2011_GWA2_43_8]HAU39978.1 hypothetical protein [Candidatus Peregrinibacteria bacterium]
MSLSTPPSIDQAETRKDRYDLRPALEFVAGNLPQYKAGLTGILARPVDPASAEKIGKVECFDYENLSDSQKARQVFPEMVRSILERMPAVLVALSKLQVVVYRNQVLVPRFDENGDMQGVPRWISEDTFLQEVEAGQLHPSRVIVGVSDGAEIILPTSIPKTVSEDDTAVFMYQVHVLLHEFFHSVEMNFRNNPAEMFATRLESGGFTFTFKDWLDDFGRLVLAEGFEPISRYSATCKDMLTPEIKGRDPVAFRRALMEEICETFVASQLGLVPYAGSDNPNRHMRISWMSTLCNSSLAE